jgi:hypothetical protein
MEFKKVLGTVFIKEFNTTALILEDEIVVELLKDLYVSKEEFFTHLYENCKGIVQTSESFKEAKRCGFKTAIKSDPIEPYEKLYRELDIYAKNNY